MNDTGASSQIKPVSDSELVAWPRVAAISVMVAFSLPTFITGIEVYNGTTINQGIWALLIASGLLTLIGGLMGVIGAQTRMSSYLLVKVAFGDKGAAIVNFAFAISLIGWFGVNIDLFSEAVQRLSEQTLDVFIPAFYIELLGGLLMVATTFFGFKAINVFASLLSPIIAVVTLFLLFGAFESYSISDYLAQTKPSDLSLSQAVGAIVGAIIIGAIILPDITRFCRHWSGGFYTAFVAFMVVQLFVLSVAAFAASSLGSNDVLILMLKAGLGLFAFFIVIAGSWVLNSLNLYSAMLSLEATWPVLANRWVTIVVGLLGVVFAFFNILNAFIGFLIVLVTVFIPVCGIILVDYYISRHEAYRFERLSSNQHWSFHALMAWCVGAGYGLFVEIQIINSISAIAAIDAIVISGVVYFFSNMLQEKMSSSSH